MVNRTHRVYAIHAFQCDDDYGDWGHVTQQEWLARRNPSKVSDDLSVFVLELIELVVHWIYIMVGECAYHVGPDVVLREAMGIQTDIFLAWESTECKLCRMPEGKLRRESWAPHSCSQNTAIKWRKKIKICVGLKVQMLKPYDVMPLHIFVDSNNVTSH